MATDAAVRPCVRVMGVVYTCAVHGHHLAGSWERVARVPRSSIFLLVHYCLHPLYHMFVADPCMKRAVTAGG